MRGRPAGVGRERVDGFRHEALMYAGSDDILEQASRFIEDGIDAGEPTFVVIDAPMIGRLGARFGPQALLTFADMTVLGANPSRIIPAWQTFVDDHGEGSPLRGIGQPVWAARTEQELVECERHESLLNLAFSGSANMWLMCPYDVESLDDATIRGAERTHPSIAGHLRRSRSEAFEGVGAAGAPFDTPLPEAFPSAPAMSFDAETLSSVRPWLAGHATALGLSCDRVDDLVLAVSEISVNSVRHGGGRGVVRIWPGDDAVVCEVADAGSVTDPLAGRKRPTTDQEDGFGLWLANQLCDLVQIRTFVDGSVVRLHLRLIDAQLAAGSAAPEGSTRLVGSPPASER